MCVCVIIDIFKHGYFILKRFDESSLFNYYCIFHLHDLLHEDEDFTGTIRNLYFFCTFNDFSQ